MSTLGIGSLLEKRRDRTRRLLSEETFSNFWTRLKACPQKSLLRKYDLATGFVKRCAVVKSIHREFIVQFISHKRSYKYSKSFILFVKKNSRLIQEGSLHDMKLAHGVLPVRQLKMSMQTIIKCPPYATFLGTRYLVVCSFTRSNTMWLMCGIFKVQGI